MISSKLTAKNDLIKFITDPSSVAADLAKLEAKEKAVRALVKELYDGKAKKAFLTSCEEGAAKASEESSKVIKELEEYKAKAESEIAEKASEVVSGLLENEKLKESLEAKAAELKLAKSALEKLEAKAKRDVQAASGLKAKHEAIRKEYDEKLANLKAKFETV